MKSDEELVNNYKTSRQNDVLDELVRRHVRGVRALISQMVFDQAVVDDLTQEVFMRAFSNLTTFRGRSKFSTWLYRVALNTTYTYLAREKRSPVDYRADLPETVQSRNPDPGDVAIHAELESAVEVALGNLSPRLRAAIVLTSLQQVEVKEAAKIEGCTTATMYWRIHEARKQLRRQLQNHLMT